MSKEQLLELYRLLTEFAREWDIASGAYANVVETRRLTESLGRHDFGGYEEWRKAVGD